MNLDSLEKKIELFHSRGHASVFNAVKNWLKERGLEDEDLSYEKMLDRHINSGKAEILDALFEAGVENWEGYSEAIEKIYD